MYQDNISMEVEQCNETSPITKLEWSGHECEDEPSVSATNETNKVPSSCLPPRKKRYTSDCWKHYARILVEESKNTYRVKCIHCGAEFVYRAANGTSAMRKHLKTCKEFSRNVDKKRRFFFAPYKMEGGNKAGGDTNISNILPTRQFDQDRCRHMLARFIILDEQHFSLVEHVEFRDFITELQPLFKHISRFAVARDCMKLYLSERTCLKTYFDKFKSRIALTTNTWSSIQNLNYLCLTAHFIDENWKLHKKIISFEVMHSYKGREIGKIVWRCIFEWGIEKKVSTITMDNASSNDIAIDYLKEKLSRERALIFDGNVLHMRCTAHLLNLIVEDGLTTVRESIKRIRDMVWYVSSSPMRAEAFQSCIEIERITYKDSICLDVATKWNSTYLMLDTAIKFRKAFERMEEDYLSFPNELDHDLPRDEDWENVIILCKFLKQFYDAINRMSRSSFVTSHYCFEEMAILYKYLKDAANVSDPKFRAMGTKMKEKFDNYCGSLDQVNMMVLIAAVLDPSKKLEYVTFCYRQICDDESRVNDMRDKVKNALKHLFEFYEQYFIASSNQNSDVQSLGANNSGSNVHGNEDNKYDMRVWRTVWRTTFLNSMEKLYNDNKSELDRYLEDKSEDVPDLDLLMWWKTTSSKYKILSLMAREVLSIPVTAVGSESAFSTSGHVLDGFRSSLTPKVVEALICTQDWLKAVHAPINVEECIEDAEKFELGDMDD